MKKYSLFIMILICIIMFSGCNLSSQKTQLKVKLPGSGASKMSCVDYGDNQILKSVCWQA